MNLSAPSPLKSVGLLLFLATGIIGWQLAAPSAPVPGEEAAPAPVTKHSPRPARASRSAEADVASKRMGSIRAVTDPGARILATVSLAESLSPSEFAAWMDGGWFNLRGGPELMIFSKILMDRWLREDPEGLMAWAAKNRNGKADGLMNDWAAHQPQRLIDYFRSHRDDGKELQMLAKIAAGSPDLALHRFREMVEAGIAPDAARTSGDLINALAGSSPSALEAMLGSLDSGMKQSAEWVLSRLRLDTSFDDEIRNLQGRKDGWRIFSGHLEAWQGIGTKLLGDLENLPPEWRSGLALNPWRSVSPENAQQWWDADLEGAGFSSSQAKSLRIQALQHLGVVDPETTLERMAGLNLEPYQRNAILDGLFSLTSEPEKAWNWIARLPTQEEQETATRILDGRMASDEVSVVASPDELLGRLAGENENGGQYFSQLKNWDAEGIAALSTGFKTLPDEQKHKVSRVIIGRLMYGDVPADLRDEAVRYVVDNATSKEASQEEFGIPLNATISQYVVNLSANDPAAASQWVESLPANNNKAWVQKNLLSNWKQYDPKAAATWEKSLPASERAVLAKIGN